MTVELAPERKLLANIRRDSSTLHALLDRVNSHWVYEDGLYRFYYGSASLMEPPQPMPSGYAALLCLFRLR